MRFVLTGWLVLVLGFGFARGQTPPDASNTVSLKVVVDKLEDNFLEEIETTPDPDKVFDRYETRLTGLIGRYPGQPEPYLGLMELFEKCGAARTRRLLNDSLARTDLPSKVRAAYEQTETTLDLIGTPLALTFIALDGSVVRFEELRGKVVIVDFWATWCGPCVRDLPKLQALEAKHRDAGLVVVGVSFDRERSKLDAFLKTRTMPWRQVYPDAAEREVLKEKYGVTGGYLPMVFIIGRDGRLRHTLDTRYRTEEKVAALLKE